MPITLTPIGTEMDVTIIDDNFDEVESLFRSRLTDADFLGKFDRFHLRRYTAGKLVSATSLVRKSAFLPENATATGRLDAIYRYTSLNNPNPSSWMIPVDDRPDGGGTWGDRAKDWTELAREPLGLPGPSFIYQWQEDGIPASDISTYATVYWPPDNWQSMTGNNDWCFSPWLTIPDASLRVYVPEGCLARVSGACRGALTFTNIGYGLLFAGLKTYPYDATMEYVHYDREQQMLRFALIVDTNPVLYTDEFENVNPNIHTPGTTNMAPYCSWKVLTDKAFYCGQRQSHRMKDEVILKGGRYYNFRFAYRDGCIRGCVALNFVGATAWSSGSWWEGGGLTSGYPGINAAWTAGWPGHLRQDPWPQLPGLVLWESAEIKVEFVYGRRTAYITDSDDTEFDAR